MMDYYFVECKDDLTTGEWAIYEVPSYYLNVDPPFLRRFLKHNEFWTFYSKDGVRRKMTHFRKIWAEDDD